MKHITVILVLLSTIVLAGCNHIYKPTFMKNRETEYLTAKSIPPFKAPPGISTSAFHNAYPVSDRQYGIPPGKLDLTPPNL